MNSPNQRIQTPIHFQRMPSIAHEQKRFYKAKIRSLIAIDRGISRLEIQQRLDKEGLHLDRHYIGKLYDEIMVEHTKRMHRRLLSAALSSFEDTMTEVIRLAWEIANTPYISTQARVMALRETLQSRRPESRRPL
jgi:hypothetical protein